ncbi:hypothetical protein [Chondromyces crocatus]|uniref:Uncharacterized protein n=1 Tax=Chondromyces crocatus TaxID=52 RepID=A0A0K1EQ22_CHOCO|nr:hypothetical protein [Chondromyces crocatus]AKT42713.1 uncharacterized protein CMC5_069400 [Chondromyces crocatus]
MDCCLLVNYHAMLGVDFHDSFPMFVSPPIPRGPHMVGALLKWGPWFGGNNSEKVDCIGGDPMGQGTDIGMLIPHIPLVPNVYFWLYTLASSSQSHFGVSSVRTDAGPVAVAVLVIVNFNLDCEGPLTCPPLPTGLVLAPNTVLAGMTLGDFLASLVTMILTAAIQYVINLIFGKLPIFSWIGKIFARLGKGLFNLIGNLAIRILPPRVMLPTVLTGAILGTKVKQVAASNPAVGAIATNVRDLLFGWGVGSPMGYAYTNPSDSSQQWNIYGQITGSTGRDPAWVGRQVYEAPDVDEYP